MKKTMFTPLILGLSLVPAFGADPVAPPAVSQPGNVSAPATPPPPPDSGAEQARVIVPLRTLSVVQNARERRTPWQQSADQAVVRIADASLKSTVMQQLSAVAPQVAKILMQQPSENAIVTIAVYKERGSDRQVLGAVAFEGVGDALNPSFYARVIANDPQVPGAKEDLAQKLELDPVATSYLCFFLDHGDLKADDITHAQMKKSLDLGIEQARQAGEVVGGAGAPQQVPPVEQQQQPVAIAPQQPVPSGAQSSDWTTPYWDTSTPESSPYYGVDGWLPWFAYVPAYGQQVVIVNPDFRHREHWLRHDRDEHGRAVVGQEHAVNAGERERGNTGAASPGTHTPPERPRLILPSAPREPLRNPSALPVAPRTPQGPLQGTNEPPVGQSAPGRQEAPARVEPARETPAREAPAHEAPAPAHEAPAKK